MKEQPIERFKDCLGIGLAILTASFIVANVGMVMIWGVIKLGKFWFTLL